MRASHAAPYAWARFVHFRNSVRGWAGTNRSSSGSRRMVAAAGVCALLPLKGSYEFTWSSLFRRRRSAIIVEAEAAAMSINADEGSLMGPANPKPKKSAC